MKKKNNTSVVKICSPKATSVSNRGISMSQPVIFEKRPTDNELKLSDYDIKHDHLK